MQIFEWDEEKAKSNFGKHEVTFEEAKTVFEDVRHLKVHDVAHSFGEERWHLIGKSAAGRVLIVVYTERSDNIRIISSRLANKKERNGYEADRF